MPKSGYGTDTGRIHVLLVREGWIVNPKRIYRLYNELGLQLRKKSPKRRANVPSRRDDLSKTGMTPTVGAPVDVKGDEGKDADKKEDGKHNGEGAKIPLTE